MITETGSNEIRSGGTLPDSPGTRAAAGANLRHQEIKPKMLVVDDERDIRRLIISLLAPDFELREASDGLQALNELARTRFDCVISDIEMPGMTGVELARRVKAASPRIKVILISGSGKRGRESARKSGAEHYLEKPFRFKDLLAAIRN